MKVISDNIKSIIALMIVVFSFFLLTLLAFQHVSDKYIISQILVADVGLLTGVAGYYFGYSQGASKKDEAQAAAMANNPGTPTINTTSDNTNINVKS